MMAGTWLSTVRLDYIKNIQNNSYLTIIKLNNSYIFEENFVLSKFELWMNMFKNSSNCKQLYKCCSNRLRKAKEKLIS